MRVIFAADDSGGTWSRNPSVGAFVATGQARLFVDGSQAPQRSS